jgi:hypothetical protein
MFPEYILIYKTDECLKQILNSPPFCGDANKNYVNSSVTYRQYENYRLICYKTEHPHFLDLRGHRAFGIMIEKILYDKISKKYWNILKHIIHLCPFAEISIVNGFDVDCCAILKDRGSK